MGSDDLTINGQASGGAPATDPARIIEIAESDAAQLPRLRDQRSGWDEMLRLAEHVEGFLDGRVSNRLDGNLSESVASVVKQTGHTKSGVSLLKESAQYNRDGYDRVIPTVERLHERVRQLDGELGDIDAEIRDLPEDLAPADRESVTDVKSGLLRELRQEFAKSSGDYQMAHKGYAYEPPQYRGAPEWTGPEPRVYPGTGSGSEGGMNPHGVGGVNHRPEGLTERPVGGSPTGSDRPGVDPVRPIGDPGPQLQTPGTGPAPAPAPTTPPVTGGGGGPVGGLPPGPVTTPPGGGLPPKPVIPPSGGGRPTPAMPPARPTPGMGTRPTPGLGGGPRPIGGGANPGRAGGGNLPPGRSGGPVGSKASRALLPNQRGGGSTTGTNPGRTGPAARPATTGRPTATTGGANPGRTGTGSTGRPGVGNGGLPGRGTAAKGRGGQTGGRANAPQARTAAGTGLFGGNQRATVPSVIGGRDQAAPSGAKQPGATTGRVFGERVNKGAKAKAKAPKQKGGILTGTGKGGKAKKRKKTRDWINAPIQRRTGEVEQGKVFGQRQAPVDPLEAAAEQALRAREQAAQAKAVAQWRARRNALPDNDLVEGLDATVVPDVIQGPDARAARVRRRDVGRVFGAGGWEN